MGSRVMDFPSSRPLPPIGSYEGDLDKVDTEDRTNTDTASQDTDRSKVTDKGDDDRSSVSRGSRKRETPSASSTKLDRADTGKERPRIMRKFRPEPASTDEESEPEEEESRKVSRTVSFSEMREKSVKSPALKETSKRTAYDGREVMLVSLDTQTDWDWVKEMEAKGHTRPPTASEKSSEQDDRLTSGTHGKSDSSQPESQFDDKTVTGTTPFTLPYSDEFGIPMLELSSDTDDSSDEESSSRKTKDDREFIPSVGPPQILQYIRESQKKDIDVEEPESRLPTVAEDDDLPKDGHGLTHGMLSGDCEFCHKPIKPFPTLEQQLQFPPEHLYCCDQYREFVEFALNTTEVLENEEKQKKKLISIKPHEHHGSKQERNAAKEKAVQRMRQRELERRAQEASGIQQNFFASSGGVSVLKYTRAMGSSPVSMKDMFAGSPTRRMNLEDPDAAAQKLYRAVVRFGCVLDCPAIYCPICNRQEITIKPPESDEEEEEPTPPSSALDEPVVRCHEHSEKCNLYKGIVRNYHTVALGFIKAVARQMKTINYQLSSQKCLEEGWTLRVPSPLSDDLGDDVFCPEPLNPAMIADGKNEFEMDDESDSDMTFNVPDYLLRDRHLIEKFYESGKKFLTIFPDGTGNVFYPSGNLAILISSTKLGQYYYTIHEDVPRSVVIASFDPNGHGYCYFPNGALRLYIDQYGGIELDSEGGRKRRWQWKDDVTHIHAPPFQPICVALGMGRHLGLRIMTQENISLTFSAQCRSCRFNMGSRLKLVAPENIPVKEIQEDFIFLEEKKNLVETLLNKVSTLLKFPNSPKMDKILPPLHVTAKIQKTDKLKKERKVLLAAQAAKEKKLPPVTAT